jgi:hypothetical protein
MVGSYPDITPPFSELASTIILEHKFYVKLYTHPRSSLLVLHKILSVTANLGVTYKIFCCCRWRDSDSESTVWSQMLCDIFTKLYAIVTEDTVTVSRHYEAKCHVTYSRNFVLLSLKSPWKWGDRMKPNLRWHIHETLCCCHWRHSDSKSTLWSQMLCDTFTKLCAVVTEVTVKMRRQYEAKS